MTSITNRPRRERKRSIFIRGHKYGLTTQDINELLSCIGSWCRIIGFAFGFLVRRNESRGPQNLERVSHIKLGQTIVYSTLRQSNENSGLIPILGVVHPQVTDDIIRRLFNGVNGLSSSKPLLNISAL